MRSQYRIAYIELNAESSFMDEYTSSTFLPHTDLSFFPWSRNCWIPAGSQRSDNMAKMIPSPHSLATGVGALPHKDPVAACNDVLEIFPRFPYIPTLPTGDNSKALSLTTLNNCREDDRDDRLLFDSTTDQTAAMEQVYMDYVEDNFAPYALHKDYASAFFEMMTRDLVYTRY